MLDAPILVRAHHQSKGVHISNQERTGYRVDLLSAVPYGMTSRNLEGESLNLHKGEMLSVSLLLTRKKDHGLIDRCAPSVCRVAWLSQIAQERPSTEDRRVDCANVSGKPLLWQGSKRGLSNDVVVWERYEAGTLKAQ